MNKILIVGHPDSGYEEVEGLLHACGMARARPSRREGLSPAEIGALLGKSQCAAAGRRRSRTQKLPQVAPAPMWQGLALDLMLGNVDQPLWGWADPQAIHLLDYWREADPSIHFVFVYDRPHGVIARPLQAAGARDGRGPGELLDDWCSFNATVLDFLRRCPERALLVHREQVRASANAYLSQVRARIHAPWDDRALQPAAPPHQQALAPVEAGGRAPAPVAGGRSGGDLADFVADALVRAHPASQSLYLRIQKRATLPLPPADVAQDPVLAAWHALAMQHQTLDDYERRVAQLEQEQRGAQQQLAAARLELQKAAAERAEFAKASQQATQQATSRLQQAQEELARLRARLEQSQADGQSERDLLMRQLHQVQEELEAAYACAGAEGGHPPESRAPAAAPTGAAERVRGELPYRIGEALIERSHSLGGWASMPVAVLRLALDDRRRRAGAPAPEPLESYADYEEAARLHRHLRYRLGSTFLRHLASPLGWVRMPWALKAEVDAFRVDRRASHRPPVALSA